MSDFVIAENGQFPPQYNVLEKGEDGIYKLIFGPDDLDDAKRKLSELSDPKRARDDSGQYIADDPETPEVNEAYVGGRKKESSKKKSSKKKTSKKKTSKKKTSKKR
jgi:hypothetical protein